MLICFIKNIKKKPTINDMGAFFPIYLNRNKEDLRENKLRTNLNGDNEQEVIESFLNSDAIYKDFKDFLDDCDLCD